MRPTWPAVIPVKELAAEQQSLLNLHEETKIGSNPKNDGLFKGPNGQPRTAKHYKIALLLPKQIP